MTYDQKKNRLFVVISYAFVHRISLEDALYVFKRALYRFGRVNYETSKRESIEKRRVRHEN